MNFKTAIIQAPPVFLNLNETLIKAEGLLKDAAENGANVIAFPETWLPGYPVWIDSAPNSSIWDHAPAKELFAILYDNSVEDIEKTFKPLMKAAKLYSVYLIMSFHEKKNGTLYNTTIYISKNGKDYKLHRKLVPTYTERLVWGRGDGSTINVMQSEYGNIGGLICWEHWMPLARAAMHSLGETIHTACWPWVHELHQIASRNYAFEAQCFVLACGTLLSMNEVLEGFDSLNVNKPGARDLLASMPYKKDDIILKGGSAVIGPDAAYISGPDFENQIIYADVNTEMIAERRLFLDTDGHYSRPDIFSLEVNTRPMENVKFKVETE